MEFQKNVENLKDKAGDATRSAVRTAKLLALISKRKVAIVKEQEKIRRDYTKLGKTYYKYYVTDEEADEAEYLPICEHISDSYRKINRMRREVQDAKDTYEQMKAKPQEEASEEESQTPSEDVVIVPYVQEEQPEEQE
ncbi:MAG: hypothetical protein LBM28_05490 [Oscillospiraceae bacterium]|jgi:hypothetical protein|nr:hypothetical protein [Oscillospiraceae bacterium]